MSDSPRSIVVTGATGHVAGLVTDRLIARGVRPRVFVRDAAKARARFGDRVDVAVGDLAEAVTLASAFAGADAVFLVTSGPDLARLDAGAARAARAAGVRRLVKLSSYDAAHQIGTGAWHARGEAAIRDAGVAYAFVRPTGFMVNARFWAHGIRRDGVVRGSTGDGRIPFIHSDDIADVSVAALAEPAHENATLPITGPEALSYAEMTRAIGEALGRTLRFEAISDDDVRARHRAMGESAEVIEAHVGIYRGIREGKLAEVTDTVRRVLGRDARTFAEWVGAHIAAFR
jgi:uncharacterized protein YbjT (DUF2867 family)